MIGLKVAAAIFLGLFFLGLLRVGGGGEYSAESICVWIKAGPFRVQLFPIKEKKKKAAEKKARKTKASSSKTKTQKEEKKKQGGSMTLIKEWLPLICEAAGELKRRIRIDELIIDYTFAGKEDAAAAAMGFGYSNAVVGIILSLFEQNFEVKARRIRTAVDFNADSPKVYLYAAISARLGQLLSLALHLGWKFLVIYRKNQNPKKEAI